MTILAGGSEQKTKPAPTAGKLSWEYVPLNPAEWSPVVPDNISQALDQLVSSPTVTEQSAAPGQITLSLSANLFFATPVKYFAVLYPPSASFVDITFRFLVSTAPPATYSFDVTLGGGFINPMFNRSGNFASSTDVVGTVTFFETAGTGQVGSGIISAAAGSTNARIEVRFSGPAFVVSTQTVDVTFSYDL